MKSDRRRLWLVLAIAGLSQVLVFALLWDAEHLPSKAKVIEDLDHCSAKLNRVYEWYFNGHPGKPI